MGSRRTPNEDTAIGGAGSVSLYEQKLTVIHPFFGEEERFKLLFQTWKGYSRKIQDSLNIIIVDDHGSPSVKSMLTPSILKRIDFNLTIYEIEDDLKHNTPGALNLGIITALTPWVLIMDSDCTFSNDHMDTIMAYRPVEDTEYKFNRLRVTEDEYLATNERYLPCTMLMHKSLYFNLGGFDEDFTGAYSGGYAFFDNHFDHKLLKSKYHCLIVRDVIATEWMEDVVGPKASRTEDEERINRRLMYGKLRGEIPESHHMLRFSWKRVYEHRL